MKLIEYNITDEDVIRELEWIRTRNKINKKMKGKKHEELIEEALLEFPCKYCLGKDICTIQCGMYKSYHNFFRKLGKTKTAEAIIRLQMINKRSKALDLINQYNQY